MAAAGLPRAQEDRTDRARGAGPGRRHRDAHADDPIGGDLAGKRPLRRLRRGNAAHQGSPRARHALWPHERGADHADFPRRGEILPRRAQEPLPHSMEVPRRGPPPVRRDARARIPDEGCLFLRPRRGWRAAILLPHVHRLFADFRADGPQARADEGRHRPHRRRSQPRVHHPRRYGRVRGVLRPRPDRDAGSGRGDRL